LAGLAGSLEAEFAFAFGGGVRLGGQELGVQVGGLAAVGGRAAQRGAVGGFALAEQQIVWLALDRLAGLQAEGLDAWAPPAAGWFSAALAGLDVIPGRIFRQATVNLLPDVVQVVT
jgi:hypothetical protein